MGNNLLRGKKILITGLTGQVAYPVAVAFAGDNDVWGLARFSNPDVKKKLEKSGITCVKFDLDQPDFSAVPNDFDYVLNFAVSFDPDFDKAMTTGVEGFGLLMGHCQNAEALLHCSSIAVYECKGHTPLKETDPLADSQRVITPTYSICKIAAEGMARFVAKQWNIPTIIARLNVPYGDNGGLPYFHMEMLLGDQPIVVHTNKPNLFNPIHEEDIIKTIPSLLDAADVPATIVNWGGNEQVSAEDWCEYIGELVGKKVEFTYTDQTFEGGVIDTEKMASLIGQTRVDWRHGIKRMVEKWHPELLARGGA